MSPINEMHLAQDEVSDWAVKHQQARYAPIGTSIPDPRPPVRHVPSFVLTHSAQSSPSITDADCAAVLNALLDSGELDYERADIMLRLAAETRIRAQAMQPIPVNRERVREALKAMDELIAACDNSTDQSTLLQGAKARAYTAWHRAGGSCHG